jgi:hypothetical protein
LITVLPPSEGGVNASRVLAFVIETLPPPVVIDAEEMVLPAGAYAKFAADESKGLIVTLLPATALRVRGHAASGVNMMLSRKFPTVLPMFALTDSNPNRVMVCPAGTV